MVKLIVGKKGKGKTKVLLDEVNGAVKSANGSIVFLDKNTKHMYELNNKIRLIDVSPYMLKNSDQFVGFLSGIISQDHDLEAIYLDGFLKISNLEGCDVTAVIKEIDDLSKAFDTKVVISLSLDESELGDELKSMVQVAL